MYQLGESDKASNYKSWKYLTDFVIYEITAPEEGKHKISTPLYLELWQEQAICLYERKRQDAQ